MLEKASRGSLDDTEWLRWFLGCLERSIDGAGVIISDVLSKASFWARWAGTPLNARQVQMLNRLLDGFEGKMTSSKWAKIAKCSPDTALRDINQLCQIGMLRREEAGGRSTSYSLNS
jgi:Fic family protein